VNARGRSGTAAFLVLAVIAGVIAARAHYTADLSAFLPRAPSAAQRVLVEQLRAGPAARLIIGAIGGASPATRALLSGRMVAGLRANPAFESVANGDAASLARDREFLFRHRYLLSEAVTAERFTATGLHAAIAASLDALASPEGPLVKSLFTQDPTGELLGIIDDLGPGRAPRTSAGVWSSRDGNEALILVQLRAAGSDNDAQRAACEALRAAFADARAVLPAAERTSVTLTLSGAPVFAVAARTLIEGEVMRLSSLSALLITLLLLFVYRSLPALLLGLVPVLGGALAGVAAVALGFGVVHGITLGFGVTLIGEAVDYSIYLFVQGGAAAHGDWRRHVWPTIRLGVLTSLAGFAALLPSDFQGLAQLGLYSIAGLIAAALITRFVLPAWIPRGLAIRDLRAPGQRLLRALGPLHRLRALLWLVPLVAALVLYLHRGALLGHELAALSPVPLQDQQLDERLRADLGAAQVRFMVVAPAPDREAALLAAERLGEHLTPLIDDGTIAGFDSPSRYLPPVSVQRARLAALPGPDALAARVAEAVQGLPVSAAVLAPFLAAVQEARAAGDLGRSDLEGTSFAGLTDALLVRGASGYSALLPVSAASGDLTDAAAGRVRAALAAADPHAVLLDLTGETDRLYLGYLRQAITLSLAGFLAIVVLLLIVLRDPRRVLRVLAPLALAVLAVAALLVGLGERLTILHLVGMLLTVAVGSNYALFFDRASHDPARGSVPLTLTSLVVANLATVLAFGVLAGSRVPMLADLGRTVAPGTFLALLFAAVLSAPVLAADPEAGA
jgi:predicted exporter